MIVKNLYSERAEEKRKQFNRIINGIDMVLMNNIVDVDPDIYYSFDEDIHNNCNIENGYCDYHDLEVNDNSDQCDYGEDEFTEIYQWFAINPSDADFLKRHNQLIAYSDVLDTYFLAITHYGTSWDYTSMIEDFNDLYIDLNKFNDDKE